MLSNRWDEEREEQPEEDISSVAVGGLDGDDWRSIRTIVLDESERIEEEQKARHEQWRQQDDEEHTRVRRGDDGWSSGPRADGLRDGTKLEDDEEPHQQSSLANSVINSFELIGIRG
jgi:hypothetical protein